MPEQETKLASLRTRIEGLARLLGVKHEGMTLVEIVNEMTKMAHAPTRPERIEDRATLVNMANTARSDHFQEAVAEYKSETGSANWLDECGPLWHEGYDRGALAVIEHVLTSSVLPQTTKQDYGVQITWPSFSGTTPLVFEFRNREEAERFIENNPLWHIKHDNEEQLLVCRTAASEWLPALARSDDDQASH